MCCTQTEIDAHQFTAAQTAAVLLRCRVCILSFLPNAFQAPHISFSDQKGVTEESSYVHIHEMALAARVIRKGGTGDRPRLSCVRKHEASPPPTDKPVSSRSRTPPVTRLPLIMPHPSSSPRRKVISLTQFLHNKHNKHMRRSAVRNTCETSGNSHSAVFFKVSIYVRIEPSLKQKSQMPLRANFTVLEWLD